MIHVGFENGTVICAASWDALDRAVAAMPWNRTHRNIREALAWRAYVLSGEIVDPSLDGEEFWSELERVGLVRSLSVSGEAAA